MHQQAYIFVLFGTLKYKNGQNRAFLVFSSLKNGCSFYIHFWAFSMVFLADFPGSYAIHYNRAANFTARTTKKIPKLQKKFSEVPEKISRGSMKSFGLCHEIIWPVILKSFGLSQDLPLSQNGPIGLRVIQDNQRPFLSKKAILRKPVLLQLERNLKFRRIQIVIITGIHRCFQCHSRRQVGKGNCDEVWSFRSHILQCALA